MTVLRIVGRGLVRCIAPLVSFALGLLGAGAWVAGKHRWDGRVVFVVTHSHGVHVGDALALIPLALGSGLAIWCWEKGAPPDDGWELDELEAELDRSHSRPPPSHR